MNPGLKEDPTDASPEDARASEGVPAFTDEVSPEGTSDEARVREEVGLILWASSLVMSEQTFVDVGACDGTWEEHFALRCHEVHAFDDQSKDRGSLRDRFKSAGIEHVVTWHDVKLGASSAAPTSVDADDGEIPQLARTARLDDFTFKDIGLIRIDAEGQEVDVLRGASRTLQEHHPRILMRVWTSEWSLLERTGLIGYVESLGYRVRQVSGFPEVLLAEPLAVSVDLKALFAEVERALPEGGDWCSLEKAMALVALVVSLRPRVVVELGVWMGGSAIPMAIALRDLGFGRLVAVDAWAADASISGQRGANAQWWGETVGDAGHETAFQVFVARLKQHGIHGGRCVVYRQSTIEAAVPEMIDLLHHDANHGPQVVEDIARWAPAVRVGGFLVLDDLNWEGGHVQRAHELAIELGFVELYRLGTGCVMQRVQVP
jgi:FkbM family methyltransferase